LTTVNPDTGVKDPEQEPLKTLKKFKPNVHFSNKMDMTDRHFFLVIG
jgi:hypothetical protein